MTPRAVAIVRNAVRCTIAGALLITAGAKAVTVVGGEHSIRFIGIEGRWAAVLMFTTIGIEVFTASLLVSPWWRRGAWIAFGLTCGFALIVATILALGLPNEVVRVLRNVRDPDLGSHRHDPRAASWLAVPDRRPRRSDRTASDPEILRIGIER